MKLGISGTLIALALIVSFTAAASAGQMPMLSAGDYSGSSDVLLDMPSESFGDSWLDSGMDAEDTSPDTPIAQGAPSDNNDKSMLEAAVEIAGDVVKDHKDLLKSLGSLTLPRRNIIQKDIRAIHNHLEGWRDFVESLDLLLNPKDPPSMGALKEFERQQDSAR